MTDPAPSQSSYTRPQNPDERVGDVYLDADTIAKRVRELGAEITADYQGQDLLLISILRGAIFFMADLSRAIDLPLEMDFLAISSYTQEHSDAGAKAIRFLKDLDQPVKDKNVLVVEDMIDSGLTLHYIVRSLQLRRPRSLEICTLFDRPHQRLVEIPVRYRGFEVPDDFFVGYGFDYRQSFRNIPYVAYLQLGPDQPTLF
ncbi:MAG: hypoxanthine phosphoribosyltransferase [Actinobacteria bacterium]|nr:hypoxanthine phosphoribosyltransferase [Actinomycetota bacterium]